MDIQKSETIKQKGTKPQEKRMKRLAYICLIILALLFIGYAVFEYRYDQSITLLKSDIKHNFDEMFIWMLLIGFFAQMVDGALGMGYGVISTTLLLSGGLNPAAISGSIHTAEMFSSGASGFSHYKLGNVNKKLFKTLLIPGIIGAVCGALLLGYAGEKYGLWIRPILSVYTLILGLRILNTAFKEKGKAQKVKKLGWLAGAGGFLDSFGGGGWGPLVTSTLMAKGRTPKYVIGSVSLTEFFVTMASALTFFLLLGVSHAKTILGLIIGGFIAAPLAANLTGRLPVKKMFIGVGIIVIISSVRIIWLSINSLL